MVYFIIAPSASYSLRSRFLYNHLVCRGSRLRNRGSIIIMVCDEQSCTCFDLDLN